jgi:YD repeat-containing protein
MAAIIGGAGLGLFNTSLGQLNGFGASGNVGLGNGNDRVYVNAVTGNLVVTSQDEFVASTGIDTSFVRTYNSLGTFTDGDNGDNWRLSLYRRLEFTTATPAVDHGDIVRVNGDGSRDTFKWQSGLGYWQCFDGPGAHDIIRRNANALDWDYVDAGNGRFDTYSGSGLASTTLGRLLSWRDDDGNSASVTYNNSTSLGLVTQITDASGQVTTLTYSGNNLTEIKVNGLKPGVTTNTATDKQDLIRVRYGYDASNRLNKVYVDLDNPADTTRDDLDADSATRTYVTTYTYDGTSKRIASIAQTDGSLLQVEYEVAATKRVSKLTTRVSTGAATVTRTLTLSYVSATQTDVSDTDGNLTSYFYDSLNRLTKVQTAAIGAARSITQYDYDAEDNIVQVTYDANRISRFQYEKGKLVESWNSYGDTVRWTYETDDATARVLTESRHLGQDSGFAGGTWASSPLTTQYVYDAEKHLSFVVSPDGHVTEYRYDAAGNRTVEITYTGNLYPATTTYDPTDGHALTTGFSRTELVAWRDSTTSPIDKTQAQRIDYTFDFTGQVKRVATFGKLAADGTGVADSDKANAWLIYDASGRLRMRIDPRLSVVLTSNPFTTKYNNQTGYVTSYLYDGLDRQISLQDGTGRTTTTTFDDAGKTVTTLAPDGVRTVSRFNLANDRISEQVIGSAALGNKDYGTTTYYYDAVGHLRMAKSPAGNTHYLWDERGRQVAVISPQNELTAVAYNDGNQVISTRRYASPVTQALVNATTLEPLAVDLADIKPSDSSNDRVTYQYYDDAGRLTVSVDGAGYATKCFYDPAGRKTKEVRYYTAPTLPASSRAADVTLSNTNSRTTRYYYDNDGRVRATLDAMGYLAENYYDAGGQLSKTVHWANATTATVTDSSTLDNVRPGPDSSNDHVSTFFYDAKGRLVGEHTLASTSAQTGYLTSYSYDLAGNLSGKVQYANEAAYTGQTLATLQAASTNTAKDRVWSGQYDALNRLASETDYQGTVTSYAYNAVTGFLDSMTRGAGNDPRTTSTKYDEVGHVVQVMAGEGSAALAAAQAATPANLTDDDQAWLAYATKHTYDVAGRRIKTVDPNGNVTVFYYDSSSRLRYTVQAGAKDPVTLKVAGEVVETTYNVFGEISGTIRYATRITDMSPLNGGSVLTEVTSRVAGSTDDRTVSFEYLDKRGLLTKRTDELTFTTQNTYGHFGELDTQVVDVGSSPGAVTRTDKWAYDARGLQTQLTRDSVGVSKLNLITKVLHYDAFGNATQTEDANGNLTNIAFDRLGRVTGVTDAAGKTRQTSYDAFGQVLTITDRNGDAVTYDYDNASRTVTHTTQGGIVTTTVSNRHGQGTSITVTTSTGPESTTYEYDLDGRLWRTTTDDGDATHLNIEAKREYDKAGLLTASVDGRGIRTTYAYDPGNRVLSRTVDPGSGVNPVTGQSYLNLVTSFEYGAFGDVIKTTDARGIVTETVFDGYARTTKVVVDTAGLKLATEYVYDGAQKLIVREGIKATLVSGKWNTTAAALRTTWHEFDKIGRKSRDTIDPGTGKLNIVTEYAYDANGNLTRTKDARNNYWWRVYDNLDRLVYSIDPMGSLAKNVYDGEGRVLSTTRYSTSIAPPASTLTSVAASAIVPVVKNASDRTTFHVYDHDGREAFTIEAVTYSLVNGVPIVSSGALRVVTETLYDESGQARQVTKFASRLTVGTALTLEGIQSAVNATGFRITQDETTQYAYDAAGRLTSATDALGKVESYTYDANGNRETLTNKRTNVWTYQYDAANRLIREISPSLTFSEVSTSGAPVVSARTARKVTWIEYDQLGNVTLRHEGWSTGAAGTPFTDVRTTSYFYDARGLQVRTVMATVGVYDPTLDAGAGYVAGSTTSYQDRRETSAALYTQTWYDDLGQAIVGRDTAGYFSYKTYDAAGRLSLDVDKERFATQYGYDGNGNVVTLKRFANPFTQTALDASSKSLNTYEGEVRSAVVGSVSERQSALNALAWIKTKLSSVSSVDSRTIETDFDLANRKSQVRLPAVTYFMSGSTGTRPTAQPTTSLAYNAFGELATQSALYDPQAGAWYTTYLGYDQMGRETDRLDAESYYTRSTYSVIGLLSQRTEYAKRQTVTFTTGAPVFTGFTPVTSDASTVSADLNAEEGYDRTTKYIYDKLHRTTQEQRLSVQYWQHGTTGISAPTVGTVSRSTSYDVLDRVISTTDENGAVTRYYYDLLGRQAARVEPARIVQDVITTASLRSIELIAEVTSDAVRYFEDGGGSYWDGTSEVALHWSDLERWGAGDVRVWLTTSTHGEMSQLLTAAQGRTGATFSWTESHVGTVSHVKVEKQIGSTWYTVYEQTGSVTIAPRIEIGELPATATSVRFDYRPQGSTGAFASVTATKLGTYWIASFPDGTAMPAGDYEFQIFVQGTAGALDLTSIGGGADGYVHGSFAASRPDDQPAALIASGATTSVTPLTTVNYDVLGNVVSTTRYLKGAINVTNVSYTVFGAHADDQAAIQRFDSLGRVIQTRDAEGKDAFLSYDAQGNLAKSWRTQTDILGTATQKTTLYRYERTGRQTVTEEIVRNPLGVAQRSETVQVGFNAFGEEVSKAIAGGTAHWAQYDDAGRLWQTNAEGVTKAYEYDLLGHVTAEVTVLGTASSSTTTTYTQVATAQLPNESAVQSATGIRSEMQYDRLGRVTVKQLPHLSSQLISNGSAGRLQVSGTSPGDGKLYLRLPATGYSRPRNQQVEVKINGSWQALALSTVNSIDWTTSISALAAAVYEYRLVADESDSLIAKDKVLFDVYTGTFTINADRTITASAVTAASDDFKPRIQQSYDRWGNVVAVRDPRELDWVDLSTSALVTRYRYDYADRAIAQVQPTSTYWRTDVPGSATAAPVTYSYYDIAGRLIGNKDANGSVSRYYYDLGGQRITEQDAMSSLSQWVYDALGRQVRQLQANGRVLSKAYDHLNRLIRQETLGYGPEEERWNEYAYDELGHRTREEIGKTVSTAGLITRSRYDTAGRIVQNLTPMTVVSGLLDYATRYDYDTSGRKSLETDANGDTQSWQYDDSDRVKYYTDTAGAIQTTDYDGYGRVRQVATQAKSQTINGSSVATHDQLLQYTYLANGALETIWDVRKNTKVIYAYDASGHRVRERYQSVGTGALSQDSRLSYDSLARLSRIRDVSYAADYGYDRVGNRVRIRAEYVKVADPTQTNWWLSGSNSGYMANGEPPEEVDNTDYQDSWYVYDANNRITLAQGVLDANNQINIRGRVLGVGPAQGAKLSYDRAGNRTLTEQYDETTHVWRWASFDAENRLVKTYYKTTLATAAAPGAMTSLRQYNVVGQLTTFNQYNNDGTNSTLRTLQYNANGWLTHSHQDDAANQSSVEVYYQNAPGVNEFWTPGYDKVGNSAYYRTSVSSSAGYYTHGYRYEYLKWGAGRREALIEANVVYNTLPGSFTPATTQSYYDNNGALSSAVERSGTVTGTVTKSTTFTTDPNGLIIRKIVSPTGEANRTQSYYYAEGKPIGSNGNVTGADFDYNYTPISAASESSGTEVGLGFTPQQHVVSSGDTLPSIAQMYYGDASLWYLVAEANGLSGAEELRSGQTLHVPTSSFVNVHNNADVYQPYRPGTLVGDLTPTPEFMADPSRLKCVLLSQIIGIVVAIIVTVALAAPTYGLDLPAAAAIGAAAGDTARQMTLAMANDQYDFERGALLGPTFGVKDYDYASTAISAGAAYVGASAGQAVTGIGTMADLAGAELGAAATYAGTSGLASSLFSEVANVALGRKDQFSFTDVAVHSVVAAGSTLAFHEMPFAVRVAGDVLSGAVSQELKMLIDGHGKIDWQTILADAFGNALGNSIVGAMESRGSGAQQEEGSGVGVENGTGDHVVMGRPIDGSGVDLGGLDMTSTTPGQGTTYADNEYSGSRSDGAGSGLGQPYVVQSGDSLSKILGTSDPAAIGAFMRANGLTSSTIHPGDQLVLPKGDYSTSDADLGLATLRNDNARLSAVEMAIPASDSGFYGSLDIAPFSGPLSSVNGFGPLTSSMQTRGQLAVSDYEAIANSNSVLAEIAGIQSLPGTLLDDIPGVIVGGAAAVNGYVTETNAGIRTQTMVKVSPDGLRAVVQIDPRAPSNLPVVSSFLEVAPSALSQVRNAASGAVPFAAGLSVVGTGIEYAAYNYSGDASAAGKVTLQDFAVDAGLDLQKAIVAGASGAAVGAAVGSIVPVAGTLVGAAVGFAFAAVAAAGIEGLYTLAGSRSYFKGW